MKSAHSLRPSLALVLAAAALLLGGCQTMHSMWDSTKAVFGSTKVTLNGNQEVPPVSTSASGSGTVNVDDDGSISGSVRTWGMDATAAHIHLGAPGQNGPVAMPLKKGDGDTWHVPPDAKLTDAQLAAYKAGNLYINVHSAAYKGGEIRGQLQP